MKYPEYIGRKGSLCYFSYNVQFFEDNQEKCLKLISFYTLYLFGHQENKDDVIVKTKNNFTKMTLKHCLKLLFLNKLFHRIFHLPHDHDKKLMCFFYDKPLVTNEIITDLHACKTPRKYDVYPCMYDEFEVEVNTSPHILCDSNDSDYIVNERVSEWNKEFYNDDECCFCEIYCDDIIDETNFTFKQDISSQNKEKIKKIIDDEDNEMDSIIMNNLIFNFRDYEFILKIKNNKCTVTFDYRAIGGYKHAAISMGALFKVMHAIPGTLDHYKTKYVTKIKITFTKLNDHDMIIVSEYKAIDVL